MKNSEKMRPLIEKIGLPHVELNVFGHERVYIHVVCDGKETALKWAECLRKFCRNVSLNKHLIINKINKGTFLNQSKRIGWFIGARV